MIRLEKLPMPLVLQTQAESWTAEYFQYRAGADVPQAAGTRYRHPEIKSTLRMETNDKCAYCESKVTDVYPGDAEHIIPKSVRPELVVSWENLTFACANCNNHKGDYFSEEDPLLNPYVDRPQEHLRFFGPLCFAIPGDRRGMTAVLRLELGRAPLVERRKERLEALNALLGLWAGMSDGPTKDALAAKIREETGRDREYSAAASAFLKDSGWVIPS